MTTPPLRHVRDLEIVRRSDDRVVAGLAAGVADRLGIPPVFVRAAFVVLGLVWGVGAVLYLAGWAATADRVAPAPEQVRAASREQWIGLAAAFLGGLLLLRGIGLWTGDGLIWPSIGVVFGLAFLLDTREIDSRTALRRLLEPGEGPAGGRLVIGAILLVSGLSLFGSAALPEIGTVVLAAVVTGIGVSLVFGPWIWRLGNDLAAERTARIRQEERAEMAAHIHDSVLQTLALIQRTDDHRRMVTLARAQERELRHWLYESARVGEGETLARALQAAADRVEADFDVAVELVSVGDVPLDGRTRALAAAAGEALTNAAKHAGVERVSVYMEVGGDEVEVFVSDQGKGFETAGVPADRRGISESIVGRMERNGGMATVASDPGEGTEVHLRMPREEG